MGPSVPFLARARVAAVVEAVDALRSPVPFHGRLQVRTAWPRPGPEKVAILSRGRERGARWDPTRAPTPGSDSPRDFFAGPWPSWPSSALLIRSIDHTQELTPKTYKGCWDGTDRDRVGIGFLPVNVTSIKFRLTARSRETTAWTTD
jgi:hypothetical protein